jgi:hypothetical protein
MRIRDAFGAPGQGIHKYRFAGIAVVDLVLTLVASALISMAFKWNPVVVTACALLAGVTVHRILGVNTALNVKLFGQIA